MSSLKSRLIETSGTLGNNILKTLVLPREASAIINTFLFEGPVEEIWAVGEMVQKEHGGHLIIPRLKGILGNVHLITDIEVLKDIKHFDKGLTTSNIEAIHDGQRTRIGAVGREWEILRDASNNFFYPSRVATSTTVDQMTSMAERRVLDQLDPFNLSFLSNLYAMGVLLTQVFGLQVGQELSNGLVVDDFMLQNISLSMHTIVGTKLKLAILSQVLGYERAESILPEDQREELQYAKGYVLDLINACINTKGNLVSELYANLMLVYEPEKALAATIANIEEILIAGHETTANSIVTVARDLSNEQYTRMGQDMQVQTVGNMLKKDGVYGQYFDAIMRANPQTPILFRGTAENVGPFKKGDDVIVLMKQAIENTDDPYSLSFSTGARVCIGKHLAIASIVAFFRALARNGLMIEDISGYKGAIVKSGTHTPVGSTEKGPVMGSLRKLPQLEG